MRLRGCLVSPRAWSVVNACVADHKLTGAPFPCLKVDLAGGEERGYVVLYAPFEHDTILAPTRKIVGVEDPFLQSSAAPNYFADAWEAWSSLNGERGGIAGSPVRARGQLRRRAEPGPASHSHGLPRAFRQKRARRRDAQARGRRMVADRTSCSASAFLGLPDRNGGLDRKSVV